MPRRDKFEAQHARNRVKYEKQIKAIFEEVCRESGLSVTQLQNLVQSAGENAEIAKIPAVRKVLDKLHSRLAKELKTVVIDGIKAEWKLANSKYDALVGTMVAGDLLEQMDRERREKMMAQNLAARDAFIARKEGGLDLSQRVWHYSGQMRDAIEAGLESGIWEGKSAAEITRDLKQYLQYPDKLFRRVRVKAEEEGKEDTFRLSKAAAAFHPGQGVYRSSYKNALRLALNETNIAYRKADTARRVGLDFVVGIEVHLSNNHNCKGVPEGEFFDICDLLVGKYPADFDFTGFHVNCRCYTTTILQTEEEFFRDSDGVYRGSVNEVKDVPPQFKRWLKENQGRIEQAEKRGKLPYFLRDNRKFWQNDDGSMRLPDDNSVVLPQEHEKTPDELRREKFLAIAKKRHAARTSEQKKAIMDAWDADRGYLLRAGKDSPHWLMKASGMDEDDIIKVLSDINDNLPDDKKWFVNGVNGLIGIKNYKYNGSTNRKAGTIKLDEPIMESVKEAFKKIANKESHHITQSEAEAMGTFWHEITHNRTHAKVVSLGAVASDYKEIANEFVARRSLPEFYKALGAGKLPQPHVMLSRPNTEYNDWVMRYQAVIKKYNLNQTDVEKVVKYGLFNGEYNKLKGVLADGLIAGGLKDKNGVIVKKSVALRVVEFCRTGK